MELVSYLQQFLIYFPVLELQAAVENYWTTLIDLVIEIELWRDEIKLNEVLFMEK